jgi:hypothetical protein
MTVTFIKYISLTPILTSVNNDLQFSELYNIDWVGEVVRIMYDEWIEIRKEEVMAYFKVLSQY